MLPSLLTLAGVLWGVAIWGDHAKDITSPVAITTGISLAAAVVTALMGRRALVGARLALVSGMMFGASFLIGLRACGRWPFALDCMPDRRYTAFLSLVAFATGVGILRRMFWARWIGLAFGGGALLCSTLNGAGLFVLHDERAWIPAIGVIASGTVLLQLTHPAVRDHFFAGVGSKHELWTSTNTVIRAARWAAIANFAALPMLLVYALTQPVVKETFATALCLAPLLGIGAALVVARKSAGVLVLGVTGVGLLAQATATLALATSKDAWTAQYYAIFWFPAGILGIFAAALVLRHSARRV